MSIKSESSRFLAPCFLTPGTVDLALRFSTVVLLCGVLLLSDCETRASTELLFDEARAAVLQLLKDPKASLRAVRIRNILYNGKSARVVCGYAREQDAPASVLWIYLEPDHTAFVINSQHNSKATDLIFNYCQ